MSCVEETLFFNNEPVAHIVAYHERRRLARIKAQLPSPRRMRNRAFS